MPRPRTRESKYTRYHDSLSALRAESYELDAQLGLSVSNTQWRPDEDELVLARVDSMGADEVAKILGRTTLAVQKRALALKQEQPIPRRLWRPDEDALIIERYPHELDAGQIAVSLGRTKQQVYNRVVRLQKDGTLDPEVLLERKAELAFRVRAELESAPQAREGATDERE